MVSFDFLRQISNAIKPASNQKKTKTTVSNKPNPTINKPQSVNSPVLIISLFTFIILAILYASLFIFSDLLIPTTILQDLLEFFTKPNPEVFKTKNSETYISIMQNLRLIKISLFILVFICITLFQYIGVYYFLLGGDLSYSKQIYGVIAACFFCTIFVTFVMVEMSPYLVEIFENTVGYGFLCLFFPNSISTNLKIQIDGQPSPNKCSDFLLTTMSLTNMNQVIYTLCEKPDTMNFSMNFNQSENEVPTPVNRLRTIYNLILRKHAIGHFVWIYIACLISTFSMIKAIPNSYGGIPLTHM